MLHYEEIEYIKLLYIKLVYYHHKGHRYAFAEKYFYMLFILSSCEIGLWASFLEYFILILGNSLCDSSAYNFKQKEKNAIKSKH